eukprot:scaffold24_cov128-Cylindrotheca_fusiformis.AAC.19
MTISFVARNFLAVGILACLGESFLQQSFSRPKSPSYSLTTTTTILQQQSSSSTVVEKDDELETSRSILNQLVSSANHTHKSKKKFTPEQVQEYRKAIENLPPPSDSLDVNGGWDLLATISPKAEEGDNVDFFNLQSWQNYFSGQGPSPLQSLVTGGSGRVVDGLTQWLTPDDFDNVIPFQIGPIQGKLVLKASLEGIENNNKRIFRFRRGFFLVNFIWGGAITFPYPVPFQLLGDRAIGWLNTTGYDDKTGFRAAMGNKGTQFIFQRRRNGDEIPSDVVTASRMYTNPIQHETVEEERERNKGLTKTAIIICPQQFGGKPGDYTVLMEQLRAKGHPVYLVQITALAWLSIVKSAVTKAYFQGVLEPSKTLPFYMKAINATIARMDEAAAAAADDSTLQEYTLLSHSIGGWIARAWLGEVAEESVRTRCKNYVSLGTPHVAPPEASWVAKLDQTRGLLKYINDRWPGVHFDDIQYTCIASKAVRGKLSLTNIESMLAYASYFALSGDGNVEGDGITPVTGALMKGAKSIVLEDVYHADVLPNPVGRRNAKLIGCSWYANKLDEWIDAL